DCQIRLRELLELVGKLLNILRLKRIECEFLWRNMFSICATNASGKSGEENEAREGLTHGPFPWGISRLMLKSGEPDDGGQTEVESRMSLRELISNCEEERRCGWSALHSSRLWRCAPC